MNMHQGHEPTKDEPSSHAVSFVQSVVLSFRNILNFGSNPTLKESVEEIIEEHDLSGDSLAAEETEMLRNVLTFAELDVQDVMIPRADINAIEYNISYEDLKKMVLANAHTRFPVYRQNLDDVAGFVHIKDLLSIAYDDSREFQMQKIIRQCLFVPPSMRISALLMKMQLSHVHMAIVVDEYGGTDGLVTLEDLMEEIVGEIEDEHDQVDDIMFTPLGVDTFEVSARIDIVDLEEKLAVPLCVEEESFETLGGLIFHVLGRVPALGEVATVKCPESKYEIEIEISDADMRRVKRVIIRRKLVAHEDESAA